MAQQISAGRTFMGGRGFSSASVCGLGGNRTYVASVRHIGNGCGVPHFSSQSLSNMGGGRRISCGGHGVGYHGGYSYGHAGYSNMGFGGRVGHFGPNVYEGVCGPLRGYANSRSDGIQGVRINEKLLKPLHLGVDPHEQEVRNHEREEMKSLNNQFAGFIDKVRYLEQQNKVLETKWSLLQECAIPARKNIEPYYENFICNMKRQLGCLSADREKLANEHAAIQQVVEEIKCKYEEEVKRRATAENEFVLLKKDVDCLAMSKAELEGKLDLLVRDLEFRRCIYPEELAQLDGHVCDTNILLQMDNRRNLDIDCIIKNVEAWYQTIAQRSKEEVNALYENRFQELQVQRGKYTDDLKINQHEIANLSRVVQKLQCEHDNVKKQVDTLQTAICDVEQRRDCVLKDARDKHIDLQTALQKAKDDLAGLLKDYHELLNTKLALDIEIATYRTLLEGEESRICTGNLVSIDVVRPPFVGGAAAFPASYGYGGGYSGGYGEGHGRYRRSFSSRSVGHGQPSRAGGSAEATGHSSADAEFYTGTRQDSRKVSYAAGKKNTPGDIDSSSTAGVSVNCGPGGGFSSGSAQGSAINVGKGCASGSIIDSSPDGGYLSGGCAPVGAIPFGSGTGGFGPRFGPIAVGCNPGCLGGGGSIGVPAVGIPAVGIPAMGVPAVGVPAMGVPAVGVGAPVGVCYPGAVGPPVNVCYPGGVWAR